MSPSHLNFGVEVEFISVRGFLNVNLKHKIKVQMRKYVLNSRKALQLTLIIGVELTNCKIGLGT